MDRAVAVGDLVVWRSELGRVLALHEDFFGGPIISLLRHETDHVRVRYVVSETDLRTARFVETRIGRAYLGRLRASNA
jgi:hypothetical protein